MRVVNSLAAPRTHTAARELRLHFGASFSDLYEREGLVRLDGEFVRFLADFDNVLREQLVAARANPGALSAKAESELLVALAPHLEDFLAQLFGIEAQVQALAERHNELAPLYSVKRLFVQRSAMHKVKPEDAAAVDGSAVEKALAAWFGEPFTELGFARNVTEWQQGRSCARRQARARGALRRLGCTRRAKASASITRGVLFKAPAKLDFMRLVPVETDDSRGYPRHTLADDHLRRREGFALTDPGTDLTGALDQANYCIWCHEQGKDSCSQGPEGEGAAAARAFKKTPRSA